MFKPTYYDLSAHAYEWCVLKCDSWRSRAYRIWKKRLDALDQTILDFGFVYCDSSYLHRLNCIWEELYCRCASIKYPEMVKGVRWPEDVDAWLADAPRGTFVLRKDGNAMEVFTGADKKCVTPHLGYNVEYIKWAEKHHTLSKLTK